MNDDLKAARGIGCGCIIVIVGYLVLAVVSLALRDMLL